MTRPGFVRTVLFAMLVAVAVVTVAAYGLYPLVCRSSATTAESSEALPGDTIVAEPRSGYTLAVSIKAPPAGVWPWLVQMGQGRAGFYTHAWLENLIGARIQNADSIIPQFQDLAVGDLVRLTPDPYLGQRGQYIVVAELTRGSALVFRQRMPNGAVGSWAYVLRTSPEGTRLLFRRRGSRPSVFDRIMLPGYYFMDRGMLRGLKRRAEGKRDA